MSCDHSRMGCVHSTHARRHWRLHCAFTAHLQRNVCSAIARQFFLACSKFDGVRSARGICLAHLGDSIAYIWRTHSINEDPWAYVGYLPHIFYFFVRRASAVASPAGGTGALFPLILPCSCKWQLQIASTLTSMHQEWDTSQLVSWTLALMIYRCNQ